MQEGNAVKQHLETILLLPCGKEVFKSDTREFARQIYRRLLRLSIQFSRKDRWKLIDILSDTGFSVERMCKAIFKAELTHQGKRLCHFTCSLESSSPPHFSSSPEEVGLGN